VPRRKAEKGDGRTVHFCDAEDGGPLERRDVDERDAARRPAHGQEVEAGDRVDGGDGAVARGRGRRRRDADRRRRPAHADARPRHGRAELLRRLLEDEDDARRRADREELGVRDERAGRARPRARDDRAQLHAALDLEEADGRARDGDGRRRVDVGLAVRAHRHGGRLERDGRDAAVRRRKARAAVEPARERGGRSRARARKRVDVDDDVARAPRRAQKIAPVKRRRSRLDGPAPRRGAGAAAAARVPPRQAAPVGGRRRADGRARASAQ
jgi:hypothetical protein